MSHYEQHDAQLPAEPESANGAGATEQAGRRYLSDDAPAVADPTSAATAAVPTPAPPSPSASPGFLPPEYSPPSAYAPPSYTDPTSAPPVSYAPQPPAAPVPPDVGGYPPPPQAAPPLTAPPSVATEELPSGPERVGRGVLFSLAGVVVGIVATVVLWQLNFIAAFTSLLMAWACIWLYAKGAGQPPRKGVFAVVGVILVGVILSLVAAISSDAVVYANEYFGQPSISEYLDTIIVVLSTPEVWAEYATSIAMYVLFAALGTVGIIMQLARSKQTS